MLIGIFGCSSLPPQSIFGAVFQHAVPVASIPDTAFVQERMCCSIGLPRLMFASCGNDHLEQTGKANSSQLEIAINSDWLIRLSALAARRC